MLIWSKRRMQSQICGRDAGDTLSGFGEWLVGAAEGSDVGRIEGRSPLPQDVEVNARRSPKRMEKIRFIVLLPSKV
jgi:hypothetical protein